MTLKSKPGSLSSVANEIKSGTFLANARMRSSRRKSRWNLLLLLAFPLWLALWVGGVKLAILTQSILLHGFTVPDTWIFANSIAPFLLNFPLLISTIIPAMVLINYAVYLLIPPARRAMDAEDRAFPGTEYATAQPLLVGLMVKILPIAFVVAVIGAVCQ